LICYKKVVNLVPAQSGIFGFEVIQPVSAWLVKAERVGAGPTGYGGLRPDEWLFDRGGVVMQGRELEWKLCARTCLYPRGFLRKQKRG